MDIDDEIISEISILAPLVPGKRVVGHHIYLYILYIQVNKNLLIKK